MSQLSDVINSYPVEHAIQFNQEYTLDPTVTGSATRTSGNKFTLGGSSGAPVYYANVNAPGGSGSWLFPNQAGVDGASITTTSAISSTWADGNYSAGVWVMFPDLSETFSGTPIDILSIDMGGSAIVKIALTKIGTEWKFARTINGGTNWLAFTPSTLIANQWYYLSVGKDQSLGAIQFGVDYWYASAVAFAGTGSGGSITLGHKTSDASAITYYLSNFYIGTTTGIPAAGVFAINAAGSIRPTKSNLYNKINSFNIQNGIEFDQGIIVPPVPNQTGTIIENTSAYWSFVGRSAIHQSSVGPLGGSGSWRFNSDSANGSRLRNNGGPILTLCSDGDYSIGFWAKANQLRSTSSAADAAVFFVLSPTATTGFQINITGGSHATPNRISLTSTGTTSITDVTMNTTDWYYFAVTKTETNLNLYINGVLKDTRTNMQNAGGSVIAWADNVIVSDPFSTNISNFYYAPTSVIGASQIAEIWSAGSNPPATNITLLESPATADALSVDPVASVTSVVEITETPATADGESINPQVATTQVVNVLADAFEPSISEIQPTIVTTTSDSVNITTSIDVTIESVDPLVTTDINITIVFDFSLDASAELLDPSLSFTTNTENLSDPTTADALMVDPTLIAGVSIEIVETPATADALMLDPGNIPVNVLVQETPATASSLSLDPSISLQREFIFTALPAESNMEMLLPSWGPPPQIPLYYLPGTLKQKIATYPIEYGVEFGAKSGSVYADIPIYGSRVTATPTTTFSISGSTATAEYSADGPPASDANSYLWSAASSFRPYPSTLETTLRPIWQDLNYTIGFWFKMNSLPTGNLANAFLLSGIKPATTGAQGDFDFGISGSSFPGTPSKLWYTLGTVISGTKYFIGPTLNTTDWNYLAIRRTSATSVNNFEVYVNGELVDTRTNSDIVLYPNFQLGNTSNTNSYKIQNLHMATSTALTGYEIGQIWLAGTIQEPATPVNATYPPEPIYVNATIVDATYSATSPDSVNIATGIPVSILMPEASWSNATETLVRADVIELNAEFLDRVALDTFADKIIPAESLTATIDISDPLLSRFAFNASAIFVEPVVSIAPNYLALVQNQDPVFYIQDGQAVPQQLGSWPISSWQVQDITSNVVSGEEMTSVGNGKSWQAVSDFSGQIPKVQAIIPNYNQLIGNLYATRSVSVECWYYSLAAGTNAGTRVESGPIFTDGVTQIAEVFDWWQDDAGITDAPTNTHVLIGDLIKNYDFVDEGANAFATWRTYYGQPKKDSWNHVAVTYEPLANPNQVRQRVYLNGSIISNLALNVVNSLAGLSNPTGIGESNIYFPPAVGNPVTYDGPSIGYRINLSGSQSIVQETGVKTDEFAIYDRTLSENEVYSHYSFMKNLSPNTDYSPIAYGVSAESGDHQVLPVQNALYQETPFSALAFRIPEPEIIAGKSTNLFLEEVEAAQMELVDPLISLDITVSAEIISVYAESNNHFVSNNTYYQYVKTNINPYRYVNFDSSNSLIDHGIDNSYSVVPTSVGGTVVSYDLGINNKSAKTAGSNYATDGVILKESEWNDSWGTGANDWHSSFWFQRAADDQSINGLRVLWNLNSYKDNQHAVLYQYQGRLHMQFNNGSGTFTETDSTTLDLFDYNRHFVVIDHNHGGGNTNTIKLYVDSVLRFTVNIGSITPTTTNAVTADSGANFEANNHPRLGVGCLITPFASTALPVVPTNTKLIVDEVYWDKDAITQTAVTNLYNAMPAKTNSVNASDPLTASAEIVMPNVSGNSLFVTTPATCDAEILDPGITTTVLLVVVADPMTANATINDAQRSDSRVILAEFMLASAALGNYGTPRVLNAEPMEASIALQDRRVTGNVTIEGSGILVNGIRTYDPITIWANYVTSSSFSEYIIPMKEVV